MIDFDSLRPTASAWFAPVVHASGKGYLQFAQRVPVFEGTASVEINELSDVSITVDIAGPKANEVVEGGHQLCTQLTVQTDDGSFSARDVIDYEVHVPSGIVRLIFRPEHVQFDAVNAKRAGYWVLPLVNFFTDLSQRRHDLDRHPLRIYPTPLIPSGLSGPQTKMARQTANEENRLAIFEFADGPGFIEMLPNRHEREQTLKTRAMPHLISAVMVGEVGSHSIHPNDLETWFPFDFLHLLSLATGAEVDAPWVEFRDEDGALVRRVHLVTDLPAYRRGRGCFSFLDQGELGHLLAVYQRSSYYRSPFLRAHLKRAIAAGNVHLHLEERWAHLIQALDGLTEHFGLATQNLLKGLTSYQKQEIKAALDVAAGQIRSVTVDPNMVTCRDRIADRLRSAAQTDRHFGMAVVDLMDKYGLADASVVDAFLSKHPISGNQDTLGKVLSHYRGTIIHEGALDLKSDRDYEDAHRVLFHIHDVLVRILLLMVGYKEKYVPLVPEDTWIRRSVRWVTAATDPEWLGYE